MVTVDFLFKNMLKFSIDKILISSKDNVLYVICYEGVNSEIVISSFTLDRKVMKIDISPETKVYYR